MGEPNWKDMSSAPKDGTPVFVHNKQTHHMKILARWGKYTGHWGNSSDEWIIVRDYERFMPMRPGTFVIPDEWRPASSDEMEGSPHA